MPLENVQVGGWIQAYCTSCRAVREHIVVALVGSTPVKVECTSCHGQHRYRAHAPGEGAAPVRKTRTSPAAQVPKFIELDALIGERKPVPYVLAQRYDMGDVISHPQFGTGVVIALPGPQKMDVMFRQGNKVLLHDRGAARAGLLSPTIHVADETSFPTDAPPRKRP